MVYVFVLSAVTIIFRVTVLMPGAQSRPCMPNWAASHLHEALRSFKTSCFGTRPKYPAHIVGKDDID